MKRAVYAGSFDVFTNGHLWVAETAAKLFDELIVAIGENPEKKCTFSKDERIDMLSNSLAHLPNISIGFFVNQYLVNYAKHCNAKFIIRGIRNINDFEFEKSIRNINFDLDNTIIPIFLIPPRELSEVSSSFVKALCGPEGWEDTVKKLVPNPVFKELLRRKK